MLNDLIGVKDTDFQNLLDNIGTVTITNGAHWMHSEMSPHLSASVKLDKYIFEELKKHIYLKRPNQGAFSKKSIKKLLDSHVGKKYVLITDIRHYFESIQFNNIAVDILSCGGTKEFKDIIKDFYFTSNDELKRGLKASATISELVGMKIDEVICRIINNPSRGEYTYSRYYDDITISSDSIEDLVKIRKSIASLLRKHLGLELNNKKTRIRYLNGAKILGLRFHNKEIILPKQFKKKIRAIIHKYSHSFYDENSLNGVHSAKSHVGTVIGSIRHLLDNSNLKNDDYETILAEYYDELDRLEDIRKELVEDGLDYE